MNKKVVGVFNSKDAAENAANQLRQKGFNKEISIVSKKEDGNNENTVTNGATSGAALGALGGLALSAGALAVPGFGPLLAAGPITAALSGAAAGGLGGALVDYGIPEAESKKYENDIKEGKALIAVECNDAKAQKAQETLAQSGAEEVNIH